MNQSRTAILVGFVIILAFIAGYKGDSLAEYLSIERLWRVFSAASGSLFSPAAALSGSASGGASSLPGEASAPPLNGGMMSSMPMLNSGMPSANPRAGFQYSSIPYGSLMVPNPPQNDGTPNDGGIPKNAYFEKLSEQMRELRQQNMVQTFSVPSEPMPPAQMFSSNPGMMAPEHFPMEAPPPSVMPMPNDGDAGAPVMPQAEESEDLDPPEMLVPNMEE